MSLFLGRAQVSAINYVIAGYVESNDLAILGAVGVKIIDLLTIVARCPGRTQRGHRFVSGTKFVLHPSGIGDLRHREQ